MELADLTAYALERYGIAEEHKWPEFPGFSVLRHPETGKWVVLCMRQWDGDLGEYVECADVKCGAASRRTSDVPYLSAPFRMKGERWLGVKFGPGTGEAVVRELLDRAVQAGHATGFTIVLDDGAAVRNTVASRQAAVTTPPSAAGQKGKSQTGTLKYADTPLPVPGPAVGNVPAKSLPNSRANQPSLWTDEIGTQKPSVSRIPDIRLSLDVPSWAASTPGEDGQFAFDLPEADPQIPERISQMIRLYKPGDHGPAARARSFVEQGRFMEDYEDEGSWPEPRRLFYPTYHDLTPNMLRGYFAWRTAWRTGKRQETCSAFAYIHIYELLNGIGARDVEERLRLLGEFAETYPGASEQAGIRDNIERWSFELAMTEGLPVERVRELAPKQMMAEDKTLAVLRDAANWPDEAVFEALDTMSRGKLSKSSAVQKCREEAAALFAAAWRNAQVRRENRNRTLFERCFGAERLGSFKPLGNAVYLFAENLPDVEYRLSSVRSYRRRGGAWTERAFREFCFDRNLFAGFVHEADRQIRLHLKAGRPLKAQPEEAQHAPFVEAAIADAERARTRRARAQVEIDFLHLARIRDEAGATRDSLLVEEADDEVLSFAPETMVKDLSDAVVPDLQTVVAQDSPEAPLRVSFVISGLDAVHGEILAQVLAGKPVDDLLASHRLTADLAADAINEAFLDEIGDNVLDVVDGRLALVEDYREDVACLVEGDA